MTMFLTISSQNVAKPCLAALVIAFSIPCSSSIKTLTFCADEGQYTVTFDSDVISEAEVKKAIVLSPYTQELAVPFMAAHSIINGVPDKLFYSPPLELCIAGDPVYEKCGGCGSRDLLDPNFFCCAEINLHIGRSQMALLKGNRYPQELQPVVQYLESSLSFSLWMNKTMLAFYKSWNPEVLGSSYAGIDPHVCSQAISHIEEAVPPDQKYRSTRFEWSNCMLHAFKHKFGAYPLDAWRKFLARYRITEHYVQQPPVD
jgi:hypothetical protein